MDGKIGIIGIREAAVVADPFGEVERIARQARRRRNCENRAACEFVRNMRSCQQNHWGSWNGGCDC